MVDNTHPPKPIKLPSLRKDLKISFSDYDLEGKPQWVIHDLGRNKFFIIGWMEHELLTRWQLGYSDALLEAVNKETTLDVDIHDLESLIKFLNHNFLFKQTGYEISRQAEEQQLFKTDNIIYWLIHHYLFFKIPLVKPDKFLVKTKIVGDFLFNKTLRYVMTFLGIIAIYQISMRWELFTHTFASLISWQGLFLYLIVFLAIKTFHELGHAYMCRRYGVPVPTLGVAFLVFWPVLYTDTTLSWALNSRARMRIALAGIWVEAYITIIAALLWANTHNVTLQTICYLIVAVNWTASMFINISPFMRFDGYYILADYLRIPNLQPRAFALTRWQIRKWLFGWNDNPPEKFSRNMHYFLIVYSVATWLYRLVLYLAIALLVYHFFIKILGIILFAVEIYYFIFLPFIQEVKTWLMLKDRFRWNKNTVLTTMIVSFGLLLFFLPINETVSLPGTMSYLHRFLIAPEEGVIDKMVPIGTAIKANQPILIINSDSLNNQMKTIYLEYKKSISELRRSSVEQAYSRQKEVVLSEVRKQQAKYDKLHETLDKLSLEVPFDGVVIDIAPELQNGSLVMKNQWIGDVIAPNIIQIEAFAEQRDLPYIKKNLTGYFYPHNLSSDRVPVKVVFIESLNANELNCSLSTEVKQNPQEEIFVDTPCYNASEVGGKIPTYVTEEGKYVPVNSVFRILLVPIKGTYPLKHVERGTVVIETEPRSYAYRVFYTLKKTLIEQSGF